LATFIFENLNRSQQTSEEEEEEALVDSPSTIFILECHESHVIGDPKGGRMIEVKVPCLGPADNKIATNFKHLSGSLSAV
jgi:hypothetical protein